MKAKLIKKLIYLAISIGFGIWLYHNPFPAWISNTIIAVMTTLYLYKDLNKISEDGSKIN